MIISCILASIANVLLLTKGFVGIGNKSIFNVDLILCTSRIR